MEPRDTSMQPDALDKTLNEGAAQSAADSTNISNPTIETEAAGAVSAAVDVETPAVATPEEITVEAQAEVAEEPAAAKPQASKEEILAALKVLSEKEPAEITNEEVSRLKQQFYAIRNEEQRAERETFVEAGNQPEAFEPKADETEEAFKALLSTVKELSLIHI